MICKAINHTQWMSNRNSVYFGLPDNNNSFNEVRRPQCLFLSFNNFAHFSSELYKHEEGFLRNNGGGGGETDALNKF